MASYEFDRRRARPAGVEGTPPLKIPGRVDPRLELLAQWLKALDRCNGPELLKAQRALRSAFKISICPAAGGRP